MTRIWYTPLSSFQSPAKCIRFVSHPQHSLGMPLLALQAQQLHELYMKTLKAALLSSGLPPAAVNAMASAPVEAAAKPTAPPAKQPEQTAQDVKKEGREPAYYGTSAADGEKPCLSTYWFLTDMRD